MSALELFMVLACGAGANVLTVWAVVRSELKPLRDDIDRAHARIDSLHSSVVVVK